MFGILKNALLALGLQALASHAMRDRIAQLRVNATATSTSDNVCCCRERECRLNEQGADGGAARFHPGSGDCCMWREGACPRKTFRSSDDQDWRQAAARMCWAPEEEERSVCCCRERLCRPREKGSDGGYAQYHGDTGQCCQWRDDASGNGACPTKFGGGLWRTQWERSQAHMCIDLRAQKLQQILEHAVDAKGVYKDKCRREIKAFWTALDEWALTSDLAGTYLRDDADARFEWAQNIKTGLFITGHDQSFGRLFEPTDVSYTQSPRALWSGKESKRFAIDKLKALVNLPDTVYGQLLLKENVNEFWGCDWPTQALFWATTSTGFVQSANQKAPRQPLFHVLNKTVDKTPQQRRSLYDSVWWKSELVSVSRDPPRGGMQLFNMHPNETCDHLVDEMISRIEALANGRALWPSVSFVACEDIADASTFVSYEQDPEIGWMPRGRLYRRPFQRPVTCPGPSNEGVHGLRCLDDAAKLGTEMDAEDFQWRSGRRDSLTATLEQFVVGKFFWKGLPALFTGRFHPKFMNLHHDSIGDAGLRTLTLALMKVGPLPDGFGLDVSNDRQITPPAFRAFFVALPHDITRLDLFLNETRVDENSLKALSMKVSTSSLTSLTLSLHGTRIGDESISDFAKLPPTMRYFTLDVQNTVVSQAGILLLAQWLPSTLEKFTIVMTTGDRNTDTSTRDLKTICEEKQAFECDVNVALPRK